LNGFPAAFLPLPTHLPAAGCHFIIALPLFAASLSPQGHRTRDASPDYF
jgi:hypothetical protein